MKNPAVFALVIGLAIGLCLLLSGIYDDNNPFAVPVFILAVAVIARFTDGYLWGICASVAGTFCVNYMFTYPFWTFDMSLTGYPLTFTMMLAVSLIISALTSRVKQQEQMRLSSQREKMHADLLRAMAHDIRTPLSSILGASDLLMEPNLSAADQSALASRIHQDAQWLIRVTENLLSITRFTGGDVRLTLDDEVLEEIIGSAIVKYRRESGALPVHVQGMDSIVLVQADATLLQQVFINLFDNVSLHAAGATGIWLTVTKQGGMVAVSVEDDGPGIPQARWQSVFDGSASPTTGPTDGRRSMGIGLSVCRAIVRSHGGDMSVTTSAHGGAKFRFTLAQSREDI